MIRLEPLTRDLWVQIDGSLPPLTAKGLALIENDRPTCAVATSVVNGTNFIVFGMRDRPNKRWFIKGFKEFKDRFLDPKKVYYALSDESLSTSPSMLWHFGFEHLKENIYIFRG